MEDIKTEKTKKYAHLDLIGLEMVEKAAKIVQRPINNFITWATIDKARTILNEHDNLENPFGLDEE